MDLGDSFQNTTDRIFDFIPNLLGFLLILVIGYVVARLVAAAVGRLLAKMGVDRRLRESDASRYVDAVLPGASPARGIARVVFWLLFIFFLINAIGALGIPTVTLFMDRVLAFLPNVIVAILIFVVAALVSGAVAGGIGKVMGDTPTGKVVATVVPALVMVIAFFMILEQLQIAPEIVRIAFAAVMFALALGLALAFGLGGREVAAELLRDAKDRGGDAAAQARQDAETGRRRAEQAARDSDLPGTPGGASSAYSPAASRGSAYDTVRDASPTDRPETLH